MDAKPIVVRQYLLLPVLFTLALADFQACVKLNAPSVIVRTNSSSPDFLNYANRGIFTSPTPSFIAAVYSTSDVAQVVKCAAADGLQVCPRSGGHSFTGQSTCKDVMIDVRTLNSIRYNKTSEQITIGLGNNLGELFYAALNATGGSRMIGIGLCPSVGTGGYLLGGGFNPYAGIIGLTCESLTSLDIVTGTGDVVTTSPNKNPDLFWASCGGGGGQFGIATSATLRTHDAAIFNDNVYFRFSWPQNVAGTLLSQWMAYDQDGGMTWFRLEVRAGTPLVHGYGVCWGASCVDDCMSRLAKASFFNVPGRQTELLVQGTRVAEFQAFIGPYGNWGNNSASVSDEKALLNNSYLESGIGVHRVYSSGFYKFPPADRPSVAELQRAVDLCINQNMTIVSYLMCIFNPWSGAMRNSTVSSAFAHHDMNAFTEYVGDFGSAENVAGRAALETTRVQFRQVFGRFFAGIYVNYPEDGLSDKDYGYLYWGQGYRRLASVRAVMDPHGVMVHTQGLQTPSQLNSSRCPYGLQVTSPYGSSRRLAITGYDMGQLAGMRASWTMSVGCSLDASSVVGARLTGNDWLWTAEVFSPEGFTVNVSRVHGLGGPESCKLRTVLINGLACVSP